MPGRPAVEAALPAAGSRAAAGGFAAASRPSVPNTPAGMPSQLIWQCTYIHLFLKILNSNKRLLPGASYKFGMLPVLQQR